MILQHGITESVPQGGISDSSFKMWLMYKEKQIFFDSVFERKHNEAC